jgi:hypothetical protein
MVLSDVVVFLTTHLTSLQFLLMNDLNFADLWVLGVSSSGCLAHHQKQQQSKNSFSDQRVQRVPSAIKEHSSSNNQRVFLQQAKKEFHLLLLLLLLLFLRIELLRLCINGHGC